MTYSQLHSSLYSVRSLCTLFIAHQRDSVLAVISSHWKPWQQAAQPQRFQQEVKRLQCWLAAAEGFCFCSHHSVLEAQHALASIRIGALHESAKRQHVVCWLGPSCWRGVAYCLSSLVTASAQGHANLGTEKAVRSTRIQAVPVSAGAQPIAGLPMARAGTVGAANLSRGRRAVNHRTITYVVIELMLGNERGFARLMTLKMHAKWQH